jgi:hypothetical protein
MVSLTVSASSTEHINLERAPGRGDLAGEFHSRKERYGFNVMAVVDHTKRFTLIHWGYTARSSDMRIQANMRLDMEPEYYFEHQEFVLGDPGFKCTENIIPMFKKSIGEATLPRRKVCRVLTSHTRAQIISCTSLGMVYYGHDIEAITFLTGVKLPC